MSQIKLSIIVPIYNVEQYLRKCVESLLTQDLDSAEYEIIMVDDGSTDGCPAICDEYSQSLPPSGGSRKGANIKVLHQPNGGLSAARNTGIMAAEGKYVQFVDSDDYLQPNVLRDLVEQMEHEDLDVLRFDYQNVRITQAGDYEVFQPYKHPHQVDTRTDVVDGETYLNERMGYACYAVQFIIRRSLLVGEDAHPILFTRGIHFEDIDWIPRMLLTAKQVNSTTKIVYNYLLREGSITGAMSVVKKKKNVDDMLLVIDTINTMLAKYPQCQWLCRMRSVMVSNILTMSARNLYESYMLYLNQLESKKIFPLVIVDQGRTYARRARLINLSPRLFGLLMHLRK
ncbi:MAG: glycosyltransferase [Bacteroidales bacterium]|nr:glycosyltransferase [Candidatus Colicola caccequi]